MDQAGAPETMVGPKSLGVSLFECEDLRVHPLDAQRRQLLTLAA
jgi:hypothetical protein